MFVVRNKERIDYHINRPFLTWLMNLVTSYFEENFIVDELPASASHWNDLRMIRVKNSEEEMQQTEMEIPTIIAINIAGTLLNPSGR